MLLREVARESRPGGGGGARGTGAPAPPGRARRAAAGRARAGSCAGGGAVTAASRKWPWAGVRAAPAVSSVSAAGDAMEPGAAELYDQALLGILQHVGNVQDFLRVLFGFLYRKTDFYRLLRHPSDRMGFPPGAAQALVLQVTRGGRAAAGSGCRAGGPSAPGLGFPLRRSPGPASRGRARELAGPPLDFLARGGGEGGGPAWGRARVTAVPAGALRARWGRGSGPDAASRCSPTVRAAAERRR